MCSALWIYRQAESRRSRDGTSHSEAEVAEEGGGWWSRRFVEVARKDAEVAEEEAEGVGKGTGEDAADAEGAPVQGREDADRAGGAQEDAQEDAQEKRMQLMLKKPKHPVDG